MEEYYQIKKETIEKLLEVLMDHHFSYCGRYNNDDVWDIEEIIREEIKDGCIIKLFKGKV